MHTAFEIEERKFKPSYSFYKNQQNPGIQRHNSILKNTIIQQQEQKSPTCCTVKDLKQEMAASFDIKKNPIIQSDEFLEWQKLVNKYEKEKKHLIKRWEKFEDNLASQFEKNQNELIKEYQRKDDQLAAQFIDDQDRMLMEFEQKLKTLKTQHDINKSILWEKFK